MHSQNALSLCLPYCLIQRTFWLGSYYRSLTLFVRPTNKVLFAEMALQMIRAMIYHVVMGED